MVGALLAGAGLGLSIAAPIGPVALICVQLSLSGGCRYGVVSGFGAATSHGIFATAAIVGAGALSMALMPWFHLIRAVSALVLVGLGIRTILKARSVSRPARLVTMRVAYTTTLMLSLSNPMTIIPYLALATVAAEGSGDGSALSLWSIPGAVAAAAAWYSCISLVTAIMRGRVTPGIVRALNLVAGGSLVAFGVIVGRNLFSS